MTTCSERIKESMKSLGLSQAELCRRTGISKGALSSYISGRYEPKQKTVYLLAKALNVNESWLMGYDVSKSREYKINNQPGKSTKELSPTAVKVGQQLTDLEKKFGYTEQQVADAMKISLDHYHDVKNGVNHILDPNLMCKLAAFYDKKWTDFFTFGGIPVPVNDNIVALQQMAGLKDDEVCKAVGLSLEDYNLIRMGEKQADYSTLEKFCHLYNIPFSMLLGSNLMQHADEPKKKLSVKFQVYINQISNALHGEEFNKQDMEELINYIEYMAIKKKRVRESEEK